jgi:precorrin-2 dehydrogenase / sirohydrochlorin ferrochelatase
MSTTGGLPVLLANLGDVRTVVIGGGKVAEGKVMQMLDCNARITLISPELTPKLAELVALGEIEYVQRQYETGDLANAFMVIGATDDRAVNAAVWDEAKGRNILCNVVDDPPHCNFYAVSVVRQGDLTIGISTNGVAPALANRIRRRFEREFGPEYAEFLEIMRERRPIIAEHLPCFGCRRDLWYSIVDTEVLELIRAGKRDDAITLIDRMIAVPCQVAEVTGCPSRSSV